MYFEERIGMKHLRVFRKLHISSVSPSGAVLFLGPFVVKVNSSDVFPC
jgi:hypothetical protein